MPRTPKGQTTSPSPRGIAALRARAIKARARAAGSNEGRARNLLLTYLDAAAARALPPREVAEDMARGGAALRLGEATRNALMASPPRVVREAACASGCAFCCILRGGDGGTITETEARRLHDALSPFAGTPDGRDWHPAACPALDPDTRSCRAYDVRPMVCRSYVSTDAEACRINSEGGEAQGGGLLGSHVDYLAVHALARDTLKGTMRVATYAMARIARGAVEGEALDDSLSAARQAPTTLTEALKAASHRPA